MVQIEDAEPFQVRVRGYSVSEEIEDMARQAETNPKAILYGTFHWFERETGNLRVDAEAEWPV